MKKIQIHVSMNKSFSFDIILLRYQALCKAPRTSSRPSLYFIFNKMSNIIKNAGNIAPEKDLYAT